MKYLTGIHGSLGAILMTTYPAQYLYEISEGLSAGPIPEEKLVYFRARLKNRIHAMVLDYFVLLVKDKGFTKADLARRLDKRPEQITRWLGSPSNLTLDTVSDLLLGMGREPLLGAVDLSLGARASFIRALEAGRSNL